MPSPSKPLGERSLNTTSPTKSKSISMSSDNLPKSTTTQHIEAPGPGLNENLKENNDNAMKNPNMQHPSIAALGSKQPTTYISPSDAIQSPTTKKLGEIRGKRFENAAAKGKKDSLFQKMVRSQSGNVVGDKA